MSKNSHLESSRAEIQIQVYLTPKSSFLGRHTWSGGRLMTGIFHRCALLPQCVHWFLRAAVMNAHRLSGLKQHKCGVSSGGKKSEVRVPSEGCRGESFLALPASRNSLAYGSPPSTSAPIFFGHISVSPLILVSREDSCHWS